MIPASEACLRFQAALGDYLCGEDRPEVQAHAAECEYCRCLLADLEFIRHASSESVLEAPPARVWTNLRSALMEEGIIHSSSKPFWERWLPGNGILKFQLPVAAAAALAIVAVVLFKTPGYLIRSPIESAPPTLHAAAFMSGNVPQADMASLRRTIGELEKAYQANRPFLEPSTKDAYQKSLDSLDNEIRECQMSIKEEPEDGLAQEYLSRAYAEKVQVLQTALEYNLR